MKNPSFLHPGNKKQYEPDPNGYFVCDQNKVVTNRVMCKKYKAASLNDLGYNVHCAVCKINLFAIPTKNLNQFDELSQELAHRLGVEYLKSATSTSTGLGA